MTRSMRYEELCRPFERTGLPESENAASETGREIDRGLGLAFTDFAGWLPRVVVVAN